MMAMGPECHFLRKPLVLDRFRPGSGGKHMLYFIVARKLGSSARAKPPTTPGAQIQPQELKGWAWFCQILWTLCCSIVLPGRRSVFRAGFRLDSCRENSGRRKASRRAYIAVFPFRVRPKSGPEDRFPARKHLCVT
jgi:hypothetical protein